VITCATRSGTANGSCSSWGLACPLLRGVRDLTYLHLASPGTNADEIVDDFKTPHGLPRIYGGKANFDESLYKLPSTISNHYQFLQKAVPRNAMASFTAAHLLIDKVAQEGRCARVYSQNIDGLDARLPHLTARVPLQTASPHPNLIHTHGTLGHMFCTHCLFVEKLDLRLFQGSKPPSCSVCPRVNRRGRTISPGTLRPRILLYGHPTPPIDSEYVATYQATDLRSPPDTFVVMGTSLGVPGARKFVMDMCHSVHERDTGTTVWVNKDEPKGGVTKDCWDVVVKGTTDQFADYVQW
jgi:NAD+-dependent protein deacetylase SIR2